MARKSHLNSILASVTVNGPVIVVEWNRWASWKSNNSFMIAAHSHLRVNEWDDWPPPRDFPSEFSLVPRRYYYSRFNPSTHVSPRLSSLSFSPLFGLLRFRSIASKINSRADGTSNCLENIIIWICLEFVLRDETISVMFARVFLNGREKRPRPACSEDNFGVAAQIDRATRSHSFELRSNSAGDFTIVATNWYTPWPPAQAAPTSVHTFCKWCVCGPF